MYYYLGGRSGKKNREMAMIMDIYKVILQYDYKK